MHYYTLALANEYILAVALLLVILNPCNLFVDNSGMFYLSSTIRIPYRVACGNVMLGF